MNSMALKKLVARARALIGYLVLHPSSYLLDPASARIPPVLSREFRSSPHICLVAEAAIY
jgi:hypothetical protein